MSIIMEGYDWGLQGSLWGMIEYRKVSETSGRKCVTDPKTFGSYYPELDDWQPTAAWQVSTPSQAWLTPQSAISQAPSIGAIFGVYWGAWLNDRYGYRKSLMINYVICIPIIFIFFFATNRAMLLMGGLLIGLPFGCFACLGEAYASEICPIRLRAYMTGYVNICWNIGTSSRG
jgi:SP family general alpha glucoside:H+ symporter-like MFS transporter